jgi:hypothetical protein
MREGRRTRVSRSARTWTRIADKRLSDATVATSREDHRSPRSGPAVQHRTRDRIEVACHSDREGKEAVQRSNGDDREEKCEEVLGRRGRDLDVQYLLDHIFVYR